MQLRGSQSEPASASCVCDVRFQTGASRRELPPVTAARLADAVTMRVAWMPEAQGRLHSRASAQNCALQALDEKRVWRQKTGGSPDLESVASHTLVTSWASCWGKIAFVAW
eukprot:m.115904 g.115904  ORF g.115904 m.115904 type:complete len:111 (-) comp51922_c0_seq20:2192-2524(-)